jgi:hypothetical protein
LIPGIYSLASTPVNNLSSAIRRHIASAIFIPYNRRNRFLKEVSMAFLRFFHLFVFVFWYGTLLYFTLIQAPILYKNLPRDLFGLVQAKLFPVYYWISYICGTLLVLTYNQLHPLKNYENQDCVKMTALCLMLLFSLAQGLWIGPRVARLRAEKKSAEEAKDASKIGLLGEKFGKAHGLSSLFNLLVILAGLVYLIYFNREASHPSFLKSLF